MKMVKLRWLKTWKERKPKDISNVGEKSAENFISQGYAEYVKEPKKKKISKKNIKRKKPIKEIPKEEKVDEKYFEILKGDLEGNFRGGIDDNCKDENGLYIEKYDSKVKRCLMCITYVKKHPEKYKNAWLKWAKEKNKEITKQNLIDKVKQKVNEWAYTYKENQVEIEVEIGEFAQETKGGYNLTNLRKLVNDEIKKRKERIKDIKKKDKKEYIEEKEKEFKESDFLFSCFNQFTDYLQIAKDFHKKQPFYYDQYRIWWLWNTQDKKWERVDDINLMNAIDENTQNPTANLSVKGEIIESLKRIGRKHKPEKAEKTWIQFKDLIYDIKTEEFLKVSPEYFITNPIPWSIGSSDETPVMDRILKEWVFKEGFQDESYVKTLKEIMAYVLLTYTPIHRIFCLIGEGLNGKGTFLRLIEKLIGENNYCATEIEILSSNRFESNKLHKKLVCFISEIDKGIFKKTKTIKSLTGEDTVRIEFKGKDGFDNKNYANPIITTNHLPETSDKTKGFYRRWTIVDFPNTFDEKKNILDEIPEEEYNNFCKQSLQILKELITNGEFTNDGTIQEREDKYEKHSNYINEFVRLYCKREVNSYIEFADFCEKYNEFLISESMTKKSKVEIGRIIVLKGFKRKIRKVSQGMYPTTKMCIEGIKWKLEVEELIN